MNVRYSNKGKLLKLNIVIFFTFWIWVVHFNVNKLNRPIGGFQNNFGHIISDHEFLTNHQKWIGSRATNASFWQIYLINNIYEKNSHTICAIKLYVFSDKPSTIMMCLRDSVFFSESDQKTLWNNRVHCNRMYSFGEKNCRLIVDVTLFNLFVRIELSQINKRKRN